MPTALDRVQVLLQPKVFADLKTLAKHNKHSLSRMAAELVVHAMNTPTFKAQLEEAAIKFPPKQDPRIGAPQAQFREEITQAAIDGADLNKPEIKRLLSALLSQPMIVFVWKRSLAIVIELKNMWRELGSFSIHPTG